MVDLEIFAQGLLEKIRESLPEGRLVKSEIDTATLRMPRVIIDLHLRVKFARPERGVFRIPVRLRIVVYADGAVKILSDNGPQKMRYDHILDLQDSRSVDKIVAYILSKVPE